MRIYTRTGDTGETGLFGGQRVSKNHPRVAAYGTVDELNALLGLAVAQTSDAGIRELLEAIQADLFVVGGDLATPMEEAAVGAKTVPRVREAQVAELEGHIDSLEGELPPLTNFILPGGTETAATIHLARAVCRRAERETVALAGKETLNPELGVYLNRLSDLLFVLARVANHRAHQPETPWNP